MELPILAALSAGEIAEALRDYVLRRQGLDPAATPVTAQITYNHSRDGIIAAVHLRAKDEREPVPRRAEPGAKE